MFRRTIATYPLITETLIRAAYIGYDYCNATKINMSIREAYSGHDYCSAKISTPYAAANPKQVNETIEALMQEISVKIARLKADKNSQNAK